LITRTKSGQPAPTSQPCWLAATNSCHRIVEINKPLPSRLSRGGRAGNFFRIAKTVFSMASQLYTGVTNRQRFVLIITFVWHLKVYCPSSTNTYPHQLTGPFDLELIDKLPPSVKYVCHNGAGYDNIDIAACTNRGPPEFRES
jgi:hypothetical protein